METIFRLKASELNSNFVTTLKALFRKREIEIIVSEVPSDETEFLLKDPKSREYLLEAIEEVKQNKNLVSFNGEEFEKYNQQLLNK
jgi:antitoxin YefM